MITRIISTLSALLIASAVVAGEVAVYEAEDSSPVIRILNGYSDDATFSFTRSAATGDWAIVVGDTTATFINPYAGGTATVAELVSWITSFTNAEGGNRLTVDADPSISSSSVSNVMVLASQTIKQGKWGEPFHYDTSLAKFYSVYLPGADVGGQGGVDRKIKKIYGSIGGTGSITINTYLNGTEYGERIIVSPAYVSGVASATNVSDEVGPGILDLLDEIPFGNTDNLLIKATRATTGTTGGIGVIVKQD